MKKLLMRLVTFIIAFGIIVSLQTSPHNLLADEASSDNEEIFEAINNLKFYSSFNYQTISPDNLDQISVDFYLPVNYGDVSITWNLDSDYLEINQSTQVIEIRSVSGYIDISVYKISIIDTPNVFEGDQAFYLIGSFTYNNDTEVYTYIGSLSPTIPSDFFGGAIYTFVRYASLFLEGALTTLGLSLAGTVIGFIVALFIVSGKTIEIDDSESKPRRIIKTVIQKLSSFYITLFRGTPMIVQASFFWYGLGLFGDPMLCGLFVVSINTSAYIAEIIRGGINSIDFGQTEAAKSLGMTRTQTMLFIIFPQAIKNSMPAIGNEFVINIKDTAVLSVIGIFELFNQTKRIAGMHYRQLEAYFVVALIYLFLTYSVTSILKYVEKRMDMKVTELPSSN